MKPYHFHQLLEDIQIYVCTNGPELFEMKNDRMRLEPITETINIMTGGVIIMNAANNFDVS